MSLLFDPTTDRKRRHRVVRKKHTKHKPDLSRRVVHAKKTEPNFDSLIYSIGELPVFVELGIEYDDELEKDTRPPTLTFEMLAHEKLNAEQILQRINESRKKNFAVPFDKIVILMRTGVDAFEEVVQQVKWDHVELAQCYVKFRYPILMLIRVAY